MRNALLLTFTFSLLLALPIAAQPVVEVTPFVGYTLGGSFDEFYLPNSVVESVNINDSASYGLILDVGNKNGAFEFTWSRQDSNIEGNGGAAEGLKFDYRADNYQFGYVGYYPTGGPTRPYLNASLGFTNFKIAGASSDSKFSWALGAGVRHDINDRLAARLQVRWIPTYVNSDSGYVFCDPFYGCYSVADDNYINQTEISAGLSIRLGR